MRSGHICARVARRCSCSIPPVGESARTGADARGAAEGVGHHARTRCRHRRQRHGPAARHRRVGTRCGELSAAPGDGEFRAADRVSALAVGEAARPAPSWARRTRRTCINTSERSWSESDVKSLASGGKVSLDEASGDHRGPITIALSLSMDAPDAPPPRLTALRRISPLRVRSLQTAGSRAEDADAHHGRRRLRLRVERRRGDSGQRRSVRQHEQLADAAGRSHLDPPA